jgi:glucosyl-3-phosphoglycerate synthase
MEMNDDQLQWSGNRADISGAHGAIGKQPLSRLASAAHSSGRMSDFFQTGVIATLHRLGKLDLARMERELAKYAEETPIALVLPCHVRELGSAALRLIVRELSGVKYLKQIIVGLDGATRSDWKRARPFFSKLPGAPVLIWNDGPRILRLFHKLEAAGLAAGPSGKGRNAWICFGYALASGQARMVAVHDCDIVNYDREMLARLCYPVAHPNFGFDFCKGYYARVTDKLNGRVMRLLVTPLLRALRSVVGPHPFLTYLDSFRYPLAGEISMHLKLMERLQIPSDWALEVGTLAEVFRNVLPRVICQSELCGNYEHKHQDLSESNPGRGLSKMAIDIARSIFRRMAAEGIPLDAVLFDALLISYVRHAEDTLRFYEADAAINGLGFSHQQEESAVATFVRSIRAAACFFQEDPATLPLIPNWNRVSSVLPGFYDELREAVALDNAPLAAGAGSNGAVTLRPSRRLSPSFQSRK